MRHVEFRIISTRCIRTSPVQVQRFLQVFKLRDLRHSKRLKRLKNKIKKMAGSQDFDGHEHIVVMLHLIDLNFFVLLISFSYYCSFNHSCHCVLSWSKWVIQCF